MVVWMGRPCGEGILGTVLEHQGGDTVALCHPE